MSTLGNILWIIFGGLIASLLWVIAGLVLCVTIVGIPFGVQCFKIAGLILCPFGKEVQIARFGVFGLLGNILWIVLLGWELCVAHLVMALLLTISIIGIPFALQHLKLARLSLIPFGSQTY